MNEKLSLQDLVDLLSKKAKITKKDADSFYRELFQLVLERIFDNDIVKIKDFGTFKLISVSSRESVNVNTGEKIEIPPHYKLSFIPDKILKNMVNKPFSQFETILLEDGVVFEASVDDEDVNEDDIIDEGELDIINDDEDIVVETPQPIITEEPVPVASNIKPEVQEKSEPIAGKPQTSAHQSYSRSFVYTYTTTPTTEDKPGSITLTVPKDEVVGAAHTPKADPTPVKEVPEKKEFPIELRDLSKIPVVDNDLIDDLEDEAPIEEENVEIQAEEKPQEIEQKEEVVSDSKAINEVSLNVPLSKRIIADADELESDFDSEIETEEDIIVPVQVVEPKAKEVKKEEPIVEKTSTKEIKPKFSNEDPERPLFPIEEGDHTESLNLIPLIKPRNEESDIIEEERNIVVPAAIRSSQAGNNKPTEIRQVSFSDTIDTADIPYIDYNSPSMKSKLKKWLPIILFFLVIVGFLTYGLVKMLRKPYDYEYNLGRTNFSLSDTLPLVDEVPSHAKATNALLDSMKKEQSNAAKDTVKAIKQEPIVPVTQTPAVKPETQPAKNNLVGNADSITTSLLNAEKNGFVISDKLQFAILNKAEFHLLKYGNGDKKETVTPSPVPSSKPEAKANATSKAQYATIKRGTTLRTMATTYYGSPDYWVYIYQTNKKNIANPNNVPVGTTLLIPSLSEYGISNPKSPQAIQTAKKLEAKILGRR